MLGTGHTSPVLPELLRDVPWKETPEPAVVRWGFPSLLLRSYFLVSRQGGRKMFRFGQRRQTLLPAQQRGAPAPRGAGSCCLPTIPCFVRKKAQDSLEIPSQSTLTNVFGGGKDLPRVGIL